MELLDRYLKTVRFYLPREQRDDIARELSENLLSQMEDREGELGRPLTETEQKDLLNQHGNPLEVAARYLPTRHSVAFGPQWIGPVLFPLYSRILALNLSLTAIAVLIVEILMGKAFALEPFLQPLLVQFGILTLIFSLAEKHSARVPDAWNRKNGVARKEAKPAEKLSLLDSIARKIIGKESSEVSRLESVGTIVLVSLAIVWWMAMPAYLKSTLSSVPWLKPGPAWEALYLPLLLVTLIPLGQSIVNLVRPDWVIFQSTARIATNALSMGVFAWALRAGAWVLLVDPADQVARHRQALDAVNHRVSVALMIAIAVCVVPLALEIRRLLRRLK